MKLGKLITATILLSFAVASCSSTSNNSESVDAQKTEIIVLAASSLTETFTEIGKLFESENPDVKVTFSFGGSSILAEQINQGVPADVFASASKKSMENASSKIPNSIVFTTNRVVIAFDITNPKNILKSRDLNNEEILWIQCDHFVPCGTAADKSLLADGITSAPRSLEPDVKSVLAKLKNKEVDAAIVYLTDVLASPEISSVEFMNRESATSEYSIGVVNNAKTPATLFVEFVLSTIGQEVLNKAGFGGN